MKVKGIQEGENWFSLFVAYLRFIEFLRLVFNNKMAPNLTLADMQVDLTKGRRLTFNNTINS